MLFMTADFVFCINCVYTESVTLSCCDVSFQVTVTKAAVQYSRQHALDLTDSILSFFFMKCNDSTFDLIIL